MGNIGFVLGTGFMGTLGEKFVQETDFGNVDLYKIQLAGIEALAVMRHKLLEVPDIMPERAYIQALKLNGVDIIFATSATGVLYGEIWPGNMMVPHDAIRHGINERLDTFTAPGLLMHLAPAAIPVFSNKARGFLINAWPLAENDVKQIYSAADLPIRVNFYPNGIGHIVSGPSFRSPAEEEYMRTVIGMSPVLSRYQHLIGMTPREGFAAAEMGIDYAVLLNCSDHSSMPGRPPVTHEIVGGTLAVSGKAAFKVLEIAAGLVPKDYEPEARIPVVSRSDFNYVVLKAAGFGYTAQIIENEFQRREKS